jgi:HEAT repeat protein
MSRLLLVLSLPFAALLLSWSPARGAQEKEPELAGVKLSAWLNQLEKGKDAKQRLRAALVVGLIGELKSPKVVPALVKALGNDDDEKVRTAAAKAIGRNVAAVFAKAREDKEEDLPTYDGARNALVDRLKGDKSDGVREACATALGEIGPDAAAAVGALAGALKAKHDGTRTAAAEALRRMGKEARPALAALEEVLADKKASDLARVHAAHALTQLGADGRPSLNTLKEALADKKAPPVLRLAVAGALVRMGKAGAGAAEGLGAVLDEKAPAPKKKPPSAEDRAAAEAHKALRRAAVTTLDALGAEAKAALPALVKALDDRDNYVRCLAMHSVAQLGKDLEDHREAALKGLRRGLKSADVEVLVSAIEAFGMMGLEGLGTEASAVAKELRAVGARDGRKAVQEALKSALEKVQPRKGP